MTKRVTRFPTRLAAGTAFSAILLGFVYGQGSALALTAQKAEEPQPKLAEVVDTATLYGSFLAAGVALQDNDDAASVAFFKRAYQLDPENLEIKNQLFLALLADGDIGEAVKLSADIPKESKTDNMVKFLGAIESIRERSWEKAIATLDGLAGGDLDNLMVALLKSWSTYGAGDPKAAIKIADAVEGTEWVDIVIQYQSGLIAAANSDDVGAIVRFQKVLENKAAASALSQIYIRALESSVRAQTRVGNWKAASETLNSGYELFPNHPAFGELNNAIIKKQSLAPLIATPQEGVGELFLNVGTAIIRNDDSQFSRTYLQIAKYLNDKDPAIVLAIANMLERQGQNERANELYQRIKPDSPYYRQSQVERALNLEHVKKTDEAIRILTGLLKSDPSDLVATLTLGQIYSVAENFTEAAKVYDEGVKHIDKIESYHWNLFYRRGIAFERLKEWKKAEPDFRQALKLYPDQPDVLNYLGYSFVDMNLNVQEGMEMIKKAVELKPRSGYIIDSYGWAFYRLGKFDDAVTQLETAVDLMPDDPTVNDHLGDAYWHVGRKLEATFQWKHALNGEPLPEPEVKKKLEDKLKNGLKESNEATAQNK